MVMKHHFELINSEILALAASLRRERRKECAFQAKVSGQFRRIAGADSAVRRVGALSDRETEDRLDHLRECHMLVQETCEDVASLFRVVLLFFYCFVLVSMVGNLYVIVTSAQYRERPMKSVYAAGCAALNVAMGMLVAWAADAATKASGPCAVSACAALLLAARERRAVERRARLLLLQLRARPTHFCAGGFFPLDLRFFMALLGSIVGYLVVVVQFTQSSPAPTPAPVPAQLVCCACNASPCADAPAV